MRRTGAVLASMAVMLLGMPAVAQASSAAAAAVSCVATTLPVPPDAAGDGASVSAILEPGTYLGWTGGENRRGLIWRDGSTAPLEFIPHAVNASGLVIGGTADFHSEAARMQLGGTPEYTWTVTLAGVNAAGDAVGSLAMPHTMGITLRAVWWRPGDPEPTWLPGPMYAGAWAIDDLGYKVGWGETREGDRSALVWDADGQLVREFGPFGEDDTTLYLRDIDDGTALATRFHPNGTDDVALVDVVTGSITPLPNTDGLDGRLLDDGWIVATTDRLLPPIVWRNGARYQLPAVPDTTHQGVADLKVFGSTALLAGSSRPAPYGSAPIPTVWQCA